MLTIEQLAHRCEKVRWTDKASFVACCVAHDDRNPSMSVSERDGRLLVHCHAGCPQDSLLDVLGLRKSKVVSERLHLAAANYSRGSSVNTSRTEARAHRAVGLSTPAPSNHPYLVRKGIEPHGIGVLGELYIDLPNLVRHKGSVLVIPVQDISGKVLSCQFIAEDGSKAYIAGHKQKGGFYFIKGNPRLWICEGFATGASLFLDTGDSVAIAFDSGGLISVTGALAALYPRREILIMADDDWQTSGNPGLAKAREAAQVNRIKVVMPDFSGLARGPKDTDFNDLVRLRNGN